MIATFKKAMTAIFLLIILLYPIVHMSLSRFGRFSSWRLGGWGMYATPIPTALNMEIAMIFSDKPGSSFQLSPVPIYFGPRDVTQGIWQTFSFQIFTTNSEPAPAWTVQLRDSGDIGRIERATDQVRSFSSRKAMQELAGLAKGSAGLDREARVFLWIGLRRLNLLENFYYTDNFIYELRDQSFQKVRRVTTDRENLFQVLKSLVDF